MKSEKRKIQVEFPNHLSLYDSVDNLIDYLKYYKEEARKKGIENLEVEIDSGYSNYDVIMRGTRLETDKEYQARLKKEAKTQEIQEKRQNKEKERIIKAAKKLGMKFK